MKVFGWIVLVLGLLGCVIAALIAGQGAYMGTSPIGIAIAAAAWVYAGVKLVTENR